MDELDMAAMVIDEGADDTVEFFLAGRLAGELPTAGPAGPSIMGGMAALSHMEESGASMVKINRCFSSAHGRQDPPKF